MVNGSEVSEVAKATQEVAKLGGKAVDLVSRSSGFLYNILGRPLEDLVGTKIADPLKAKRLENQIVLVQETIKRLAARGITDEMIAKVSPSLIEPLLEAAGGESRPELQDLWARLLANALDPSREQDLRIEFIETLKLFHPRDAFILLAMSDSGATLAPNTRDYFMKRLALQQSTVLVSLAHLEKLGCIHQDAGAGGSPANFYMAAYGSELVRACRQ